MNSATILALFGLLLGVFIAVAMNNGLVISNACTIPSVDPKEMTMTTMLPAEYWAQLTDSCLSKGFNSGIITLFVPGVPSFDVLCDGETAGPGWTVIQQRFDGSVDFYRNWTEYREGFGNLKSEFFIGLERLYHITKCQRHELYVQVETWEGKIHFARYYNFSIGSESENYKIASVGNWTGTEDKMTVHVGKDFSTYDRENDPKKLSETYHGGWWYFEKLTGGCNLNGKYFSEKITNEQSIHWIGFDSNKAVKMLIRPIYDPSMTTTDPSMTTFDPSMTATDPSMTTFDPSMTTTVSTISTTDQSMTTTEPSMTTTDQSMTTTETSMTTTDRSITTTDPSMTTFDPTMSTTPRDEDLMPTSCIPYNVSSGIQTLYLPGVPKFDVLCDSETAGPGWTVIQQRFDGSENFYRNWTEYREGFGNLKKEFFIGLEHLYVITNYQRHELYVHVESFDGIIHYARYDNFVIVSESEKYKIASVGNWTGTEDKMTAHVGKDFSTYDRENDPQKLSETYHGGWWYFEKLTGGCNLNGKYFSEKITNEQSIHWIGFDSNKAVKMLIRPIYDPSMTTTDPSMTTFDPSMTTTDLTISTTDQSMTTTEPSMTTTDRSITTTDQSMTTNDTKRTTTDSSITTTDPSITTTDSSITTTDSSITTTDQSITTTDSSISTTDPSITTIDPSITTSDPTISTTDQSMTTADPSMTTTETIISTTDQSMTTTDQSMTTTEPNMTTSDPTTSTTDSITTTDPSMTTSDPTTSTTDSMTTTDLSMTTTDSGMTTTDLSITPTDQSMTTNDPSVTTTDQSMTTDEPNMTTTDSSIPTTDSTIKTTVSNITTTDQAMTTTDPIMSTTDSSLTTTNSNITTTDPSMTTFDPTMITTPRDEDLMSTSCIPYNVSSGIQTLYLPGVPKFDVLCDSETAGPGWTVIQQRFDGSEDFYRNWTEYREGFGNLEKEFFIGLEHLYVITNYQRHELYVHVESFDGIIHYARYDNFVIVSESEKYKIASVGNWTGTEDKMTAHVGKDFSTYDRENNPKKLSKRYHGGWWYFEKLTGGCNLNGKYFSEKIKNHQSINWLGFDSNKAVKMLIRPIYEPSMTTTDPSMTTFDPSMTTTDSTISTTDQSMTTTDSSITNTEPSITTTDSSITITDPIIPTTDPNITTTDPSMTTSDPTISSTNQTMTTTDPSITTTDINTTTTDPSMTTPFPTTNNPNMTSTDPSMTNASTTTTESSMATTDPSTTTTDQNITTTDPSMSTNDPSMTTNVPNKTTTDPVMATTDASTTTTDQNITTTDPSMTTFDPTMSTTPRDEDLIPTSCIPFNDSSGIQTLYLPGVPKFDVLCDSETAGPGWTVIQQRFDGSEDFYRNWTEYREGFGNLKKEFFIGLEHLYVITNYQRHELYVHVESFDGIIHYARYDNFVIVSESEKYKIASVGNWTGTEDKMTAHVGKDFSTYDRENNPKKLSKRYHGGWWYFEKLTGGCNLNGKYFSEKIKNDQSINWLGFDSNKAVKMLIRPIYEPSMTTTDPSITTFDPSMTATDPSMTTFDPSMTTTVSTISTTDQSMTTTDSSITITDPSMTTSFTTTNDPNMTSTDPSMTDASTTTTESSMATTDPSVSTSDPSMSTNDPSMTTNVPNKTTTDPVMATTDASTTTTDQNITTTDPSMTTFYPTMSTTPRDEDLMPTSCIPFNDSSGIQTLYLPGVPKFDVLCDSETAGPGWTVIQRRLNGSEDFYRNWSEYREGFGNLDREFFIGLEHLYVITNYQRHELYVHVESFDGIISHARYDNFFIFGESENYKLASVGNWTGTEDRMTAHVGIDFSTYDRENNQEHFARRYHGGWWYYNGLQSGSNLNGRYYEDKIQSDQSIHWLGYYSNKAVKMLIRPKSE